MQNPYPYLKSVDKSQVLQEALAHPEQITELDLSSGSFSKLPSQFAGLTKLKKLNLSNNQFSIVPPALFLLPQLEWLDVSFNYLQALPEEIEKLSNLCFLSLRNNVFLNEKTKKHQVFSQLPASLANLTKLEILDLRNNWAWKKLPEVVCQLSSLKALYLGLCQLEELPEALYDCTHLEVLDLSSNCLTKLSPQIKNLQNLRYLHLGEWYGSGNNLSELPEEIGCLFNLEELVLSSDMSDGNQIHSLPQSIVNLKKLRVLSLNDACAIDYQQLAQLSNLEDLHLPGCKKITPELEHLLDSLAMLKEFSCAWEEPKEKEEAFKKRHPSIQISWG